MAGDKQAAREVAITMYTCPSCGAQMRYAPESGGVICVYCGNSRRIEEGLLTKTAEAVFPEAGTGSDHELYLYC